MAEHPFAVTRDRYEQAMALARQMARERDERFEQLKACEAERDRYRQALEALTHFLREPHTKIGEACGVDACVVCLAEATVREALTPENFQPPESDGP